MTVFVNTPWTGQVTHIEGTTLAGSFLPLLFFNIAKKEINPDHVVYPKWNRLRIAMSEDNIGLIDVAPEIFDYPNPNGDEELLEDICFNQHTCEFNTNDKFRSWLWDHLKIDDLKFFLRFKRYTLVDSNEKLSILRQKWSDTGITIKSSIQNNANDYINNTIGSNYISIGIRTGGYLYFHGENITSVTEDLYNDRLNKSKEYLANNIGSINNIYITSESMKTITDFIDLCKADSAFDGKKYFYHPNVLRRPEGVSAEAPTFVDYSVNESISYYKHCIEDLIILGKGSKILSGRSSFHTLAKLLFSNLFVENLIFMDYDIFPEHINSSSSFNASSLKIASDIYALSNYPF